MSLLGNLVQGAVGGGLAGGAMGGPFGALLGGGLGGLAGAFGGDPQAEMRDRLRGMEGQFGGRQAPQMGAAAQGAYSGFRSNQADLISRLEALSRGEGPSLAQQQLQAATDRNMRGQQAMAAGARGPSGALAQFQALNNTGMLGAQAAQDAASARIAEQQMALQQLGMTINSGRGADEGMNRFNADAQNQNQYGNLQAQLAQTGMNDRGVLSLLGMQQQGAQRPSLGSSIMAGGAGMFGALGGFGGFGGQKQGMSPIAGGNPGAGGYYTPQQGYGGGY